ncbi:MAG TPA: hypothetical protein VLY24_27915 [Bryobacteraceae bacterium]|nr:hypothetical protein [Bryobacteraceae bacterium]
MRKLLGLLSNRNLLALAALATALTPQIAGAHCYLGNGILNGIYVTHATGTLVGVGPISALNLVQFNGDGTAVSLSETVSINGTIYRFTGVPFTYKVNPDCTGSMTSGTGPSASTFDMIANPDGSSIDWIATNPGEVCTGALLRVFR